MQQPVVEDFLNLPGIKGVTLIDNATRQCFYTPHLEVVNYQLVNYAQGICQVMATLPLGFKACSFCFQHWRADLCKSDEKILLIIVDTTCIGADYLNTLQHLKQVLIEDPSQFITVLQLQPAEGETLDDNWLLTSTEQLVAESADRCLEDSSSEHSIPKLSSENLEASENLDAEVQENQAIATLLEIVLALNQLSDFTSQYLGKLITVNYWKTTRPQIDWLTQLEINPTGNFQWKDSSSMALDSAITPQQHQWLQTWVSTFIAHCSKIIRDYPQLLGNQAFSPQQRQILFGEH